MVFIFNILTNMRNSSSTRSEYVTVQVPYGNSPANVFAVLTILRKMGVIRGFSYMECMVGGKIKAQYFVYLKYDAAGISVIDTIFFVSTPSRRVYISAAALWQPQSTAGFFVLSTTHGIITNAEARRLNVGGEVLFGVT